MPGELSEHNSLSANWLCQSHDIEMVIKAVLQCDCAENFQGFLGDGTLFPTHQGDRAANPVVVALAQ